MTGTPAEIVRRRRSVRSALAGLIGLTTLMLIGCAGQPVEEQQPSPELPEITRPTASAADASSASNDVLQAEPTPVAEPVSVQAPDAGIDTTLIPVGLDQDGEMELPDPGTGAWYDLGPRPGEPGPAVVIGHVDSADGPDVFYGLSSLEAGDPVVVTDAGGERYEFTVESLEVVEKDALPYEHIWAESSEPLLRLITCGGEYEPDNGGYQHNVVVYAESAEDA